MNKSRPLAEVSGRKSTAYFSAQFVLTLMVCSRNADKAKGRSPVPREAPTSRDPGLLHGPGCTMTTLAPW